MPEPKTEAEAIALLIRNTLELYMQCNIVDHDVIAQDIAAINMLAQHIDCPSGYAAFRVGDRYYIGEPA